MKRNRSSSAGSKKCPDSEELKELFTDPLMREKTQKTPDGKAEKTSRRSTDSGDNSDLGTAESPGKVEDAGFISPGQSPMNRRVTIAGGFLDIALFTANCEQLKFVLELGELHIYYNQVLGLLITSLVLQLLFGLALFLHGCQVFQKVSHNEMYSTIMNHAAMGLVALITIVNVFIGTFGPKGTVMARCLGIFANPKLRGPEWVAFWNATHHYLANG